MSRDKYNGKQKNQSARVTVSTCYDLLNHYTLDAIVQVYNYSETKIAKEHFQTINKEKLLGNFKSIRIMDRNYRNLSNIYNYIKNNEKFLIKIASSVYEKESQSMETNDEKIKQNNYKNKMKTNSNMSVGIFKNIFIYILLENDSIKRIKMIDKFSEALEKYIIPIKPGRKNMRNNNVKNR